MTTLAVQLHKLIVRAPDHSWSDDDVDPALYCQQAARDEAGDDVVCVPVRACARVCMLMRVCTRVCACVYARMPVCVCARACVRVLLPGGRVRVACLL